MAARLGWLVKSKCCGCAVGEAAGRCLRSRVRLIRSERETVTTNGEQHVDFSDATGQTPRDRRWAIVGRAVVGRSNSSRKSSGPKQRSRLPK